MPISRIETNSIAPSQTLTTPIIATTMGVGGATPAGSGSGITFPAAQSASTDANTLDDYEEGTWTPVLAFGSISGSNIVYSGTYTKIGRVVTVNFIAASTPASNNVVISSYAGFSGLPFSASGFGASGSVTTEDIDVFATLGFCQAGGTALFLSKCGSGTQTSTLYATATYFV